MNAGELVAALKDLRLVLIDAGAKSAAQDVDSLLKLFVSHEDEPLEEFLAGLSETLASGGGKRKPIQGASANERVVADHLAALEGVGLNRSAFEAQLDALGRDKSAGKPELDRIAHGYIGGRQTWPSRKAALAAIETRFNERAYQSSKMKHLEKFRPW